MEINERRFLQSEVRLEATSGTKKRALGGYAAKFNTLSSDLGGFKEKLQCGCFSDSLAGNSNIRMLLNHDSALILGSRANGSLTVWEDAAGLRFRCDLPNTTAANDAYELCRRGDLNECSFGFRCQEESWDEDWDDEDRSRRVNIRTVKKAELFEVSAVAFPAYPSTAVSVESDSAMAAARSLFPAGLPAEIRSRLGTAAPALDTTTDEGRAEYSHRLAASIQAERILEGLK